MPGSADAQIEKHGSHADLIAVFQFPFSTDRRRFHMRTFTLGALADQFPIHKRSISTALIAQHIVTVLIADRGMTPRRELVPQEGNITGRRTADADLQLLERVFIQHLSGI